MPIIPSIPSIGVNTPAAGIAAAGRVLIAAVGIDNPPHPVLPLQADLICTPARPAGYDCADDRAVAIAVIPRFAGAKLDGQTA